MGCLPGWMKPPAHLYAGLTKRCIPFAEGVNHIPHSSAHIPIYARRTPIYMYSYGCRPVKEFQLWACLSFARPCCHRAIRGGGRGAVRDDDVWFGFTSTRVLAISPGWASSLLATRARRRAGFRRLDIFAGRNSQF